MNLYLLRHANADTEAATDDERRLSGKGRAQAAEVARFCAAHGICPAPLLTSPLPRAHETASAVADHLGLDLAVVPWLASGMEPTTALTELQAYREKKEIMLVGHEPDFSRLAARLLGLPSEHQLHFRKGSLTLLEIFTLRPGQARLAFSLPCKLM